MANVARGVVYGWCMIGGLRKNIFFRCRSNRIRQGWCRFDATTYVGWVLDVESKVPRALRRIPAESTRSISNSVPLVEGNEKAYSTPVLPTAATPPVSNTIGTFRVPYVSKLKKYSTSARNMFPHLLHALMLRSAEYTLQLDGDVNAVRVTDSKVPARMLFLDRNELPKPGGKNPLREAWTGGYATEMFYFPASSLEITNILRHASLESIFQIHIVIGA